jgi:hypothetical protein
LILLSPQHFRSHAIHYGKRNLLAILRRIDMDPEGAPAKGLVDDLDYCIRYQAGIRVRRNDGGK